MSSRRSSFPTLFPAASQLSLPGAYLPDIPLEEEHRPDVGAVFEGAFGLLFGGKVQIRDLDGHLAAIDERIDSKHEHPAILDRPRRFLRVKAEIEVSSCDGRLYVDVKRHRNQEQDNEDNGDHLLQEQRARTDLVAGVLGRPLGALDGKVEVDQDPQGKGELERRDADEPVAGVSCEG